jgi:hypothetical protein
MAAVIPPGLPPALRITFPSGLPFLIAPDQPYEVTVNIIAGTQSVLPGSPTLHYRTGSGAFSTLPLTHISGDEYTAMLPGFACEQTVEMYFSAEGDAGGMALLPRDAPNILYSTQVGVTVDKPQLEMPTFQVSWPTGWSATGAWHVNSSCAPAGNTCGQAPYAYFGRTTTCNYYLPTGAHAGTLTSPEVALPLLPPDGTIELKFCYTLETEQHISLDKAELLVNGNLYGPNNGRIPDGEWTDFTVDLTALAGQTVEIGWRFDTVTGSNNHFRGWHLGNVRITASAVGCDEPACYANCDGSTTVPVLNVEDFTCFVTEFAAGSLLSHTEQIAHYANCDGSTVAPALNVDDFLCFISEFAQGCP